MFQGEAHSVGICVAGRCSASTTRHTACVLIFTDRATTHHATFARRRASGIADRRILIIRVVVPVAAPLTNISTHIVEPQLVSLLSGYRMCLLCRCHAIPCYVADGIAASILVPLALFATTCCKLPLGLCRLTYEINIKITISSPKNW